MIEVFARIAQAIVLLLVAPFVLGFIRAIKAKLQSRRGPSLLQPYRDIIKLLHKDEVISPTTSWVFSVAPFIYLSVTITVAAMLPLNEFSAIPGGEKDLFDIFLLIYVLALGRFMLALASLDAGSAFGGMGGSREMYIAVLIEPALLLSVLTVASPAGSTGLATMEIQAATSPFSLPYVFAAFAFFILVVAETGRVPVDNPDTHLELTMVHEGMILEYSGRRLGIFHIAAAVKQLSVILLFVLLFVPWRLPVGNLGMAVQVCVKVALTALALAVTETITNKMRLFRLPGFIAVSGILSLLALVAH